MLPKGSIEFRGERSGLAECKQCSPLGGATPVNLVLLALLMDPVPLHVHHPGSGRFGLVVKAQAHGIAPDQPHLNVVAVKTTRHGEGASVYCEITGDY